MDQFVSRLRQKAISCKFKNVDEAIRDQLIERCRDPRQIGRASCRERV